MTHNARPYWPYPQLIAHRGAGLHAPENTLSAMRFGVAQGFKMIEFDVKLSRDAVPILLHDDDLERTSNGSGRAADYSLAELQHFDFGSWLDKKFAGEPILSLATLSRFAQQHTIACNIEIKPTTGDEVVTGALVAKAAAQLWQHSACLPLLSSFSEAALAAAKLAAPHLPRGLLFEGPVPNDWAQRAQALGCLSLNLDNQYVTQELVQAMHQSGYAVTVWTVNDAQRLAELRTWQVEGIFTDQVIEFAEP